MHLDTVHSQTDTPHVRVATSKASGISTGQRFHGYPVQSLVAMASMRDMPLGAFTAWLKKHNLTHLKRS